MPAAPDPLTVVRDAVLDDEQLVRAIATGRRRGQPHPAWRGRDVRRVELRWVDLKAGRRLQVEAFDATQSHTSNHAAAEAGAVADELLAQAWGNWHVDTTRRTHQVRVTKKGQALLHTAEREQEVSPERGHDRAKDRLLAPDHPVLRELGLVDDQGRVKPSRQAKLRQVEQLVRALSTALDDALAAGSVRTPTTDDPLRVVDLGCGNAYLTFAAHAWLAERLPVRTLGVDVKEQSREHNEALAARLGLGDEVRFEVAGIAEATMEPAPDVVLALHACDTATDDALARAVAWDAGLVLAAPCCHHDVSAQLRRAEPPAAYASLVRDGILRERFADTLTDALRASLLRQRGYRVDVVEFVESTHTPRNTLLRAVRTGGPAPPGEQERYGVLVADWQLAPALAERLP